MKLKDLFRGAARSANQKLYERACREIDSIETEDVERFLVVLKERLKKIFGVS